MARARSDSREMEVALLLAGAASRRQAGAARLAMLSEELDWALLERELAARRLLGLLGTRLSVQLPGAAPESFERAVAHARTRARARGVALEQVTARLTGRLADAGIPALLLKGTRLAQSAHGDLGMRDAHDVDLLVESEHLTRAVAVLCTEGYEPPKDPTSASGLPDLHFALEHERLPRVDLHWRITWYEQGEFSQDMLRRSTSADGMLHPQPQDEAAALLLFYARDGFHGLRLAADLGAWWDRHADKISPGSLDAYVASYRGLQRALAAAALAGERTAGVPASAWLSSPRSLDVRTRLAIRLSDWSSDGDREQMTANISLVGGLLGPGGTAGQFVWREVFPPDAVVGRLVHAAKVAARYGLGLFRVRRGRWFRPLPSPP